MKNVVAIIQARVGSTRLPNKIFLDLKGQPVLIRVISRLQRSKHINKIVVASPDTPQNDIIEKFIKENFSDVGIYRGSENDVLDRYFKAAKEFSADIIVRITSDCPLIMSDIVDGVIDKLVKGKVDYAANVLGQRTYPRGLDVEVFTFAALEKIWQEAQDQADREHVTLYLRRHPEIFSTANLENKQNWSVYRLTLDEAEDYEVIKNIYNSLNNAELADLNKIIDFLKEHPEVVKINQTIEQKNAKY